MTKIESLTADQTTQLAAFRKEWLGHGISTARADRAKAEAAIMSMRAELGITKKPMFIWCASPATSLLALEFIKSPAWVKLTDKLTREAGGHLRKNRGAKPDVFAESLGASLWASLRDSKISNLTQELGNAWWGQYESYWIAYYLFSRDILGVKYDEKRSRHMSNWRDIAQSCGWWWCYENIVVISERPTACGLNAQERIHCETGAALGFSDGWAVYALNGVRMTKDHVMTPAEKLDPKAILAEQNVDVRRELIRKMGGRHDALSPAAQSPRHRRRLPAVTH